MSYKVKTTLGEKAAYVVAVLIFLLSLAIAFAVGAKGGRQGGAQGIDGHLCRSRVGTFAREAGC
jgi:hypothetical protein